MTCSSCAADSTEAPKSYSDTSSIDEQAQLLAQSLVGWLRAGADRLGVDAGHCDGCPVCRLITRARGDDPALVTGLADAITVAAASLANVWGSVAHNPAASPPSDTSDGDPVRVRRVKVRGGDDDK